MKKKICKMLSGAIIGIVMVIVGLYATTSDQEEEVSDLLLENIEALASGEGSSTVLCYGKGSLPCPDGTKVEFVQYME